MDKGVLIKIEKVKALLMEISYLNGALRTLDINLPEFTELNKIIKQLIDE